MVSIIWTGYVPLENGVPNRWTWLAVPTLLLFAVATSACGGGEKSAEDRMPNLGSEGFAIIEEGRDQFAAPGLDTYRALYQSADGRAAIVLIYVEESEVRALDQYAVLSVALENPPPEFFGGEAAQDEAVALAIGDESRAFVTAEADEKGNRVWTDIYRSGKVVLITQVLSAGDSAEDLREAIARKVI